MVDYLEDGVSKNVRNVGKTNIRSVNTQNGIKPPWKL
jgi:hypothetical protein